jgi:rubredoxin
MTKEKVEIHPACYWICPECGRDNFEHVITQEFSVEERDLIDDLHEMCFDGIDAGDFVIQPEDVTCKHCGEDFESDRKEEDGKSEDDDKDGTDT